MNFKYKKSLYQSKSIEKKNQILRTVHPFEALSATARLLFIVDSRYFPALKSQKCIMPCPVPIDSILPLNETERIPQTLFRGGKALIFCKNIW